jgi:hypothetical protein
VVTRVLPALLGPEGLRCGWRCCRWSRPDGPPPCGLGLDVEKAPGHALVTVDVDAPRLAHLAAAESAHPNFTNDFFLIRLGGEGYRRRFSGRVLLTVSPVSLRITYLPLLHILPGHQWFPEDLNNFPAFDSLEVALSSLQPVI